MNGELDKAHKALRRQDFDASGRLDMVVPLATRGLYHFRSGQAETGRQYYQKAIEVARNNQDREKEFRALAHFAIEEMRVGSSVARSMCNRALAMAESIPSPFTSVFVKRLQRAINDP